MLGIMLLIFVDKLAVFKNTNLKKKMISNRVLFCFALVRLTDARQLN